MKYWQSLAFVEMDQIIPLARFAEDLGFHGITLSDHLITSQEQADRYLYSKDGDVLWHPDTPWPDPWIMATSIAQATTRLETLTCVYILPMRDPFTAAKSISTAACLSDNRVALGVGIGWQSLEFGLTGQDFKNRGRRTDEALEVIQKLMSGNMVGHEGDFYNFSPVQMSPAPTSPLPIYVGGHSESALRRAARHDGWLGLGYAEPDITKLIRRLQTFRQEAGVRDEPYDIWLALLNPDKTDFDELEDLGVTSLSGAHFLQGGRAAPSSLDSKMKRMESFAKRYMES
ncbi:MAG: TIGR03619 family F420-dependent LLM class oxidoreductase [Myxococcota bacterium]|nr:TIGR03619 family F420-dependent LLM class oxidoreductase [Myxococcota bacterium]